MPFFQPAARAQAKRHPALDGPHESHRVGPSPGAGDSHPNMYYHELGGDPNGSPLPTTDTPSPTTIIADASAPSIEDTPTSTTDEVSSSALIIPEGLTPSSPEPSSTLLAAVGSSDIIPLSSSPSSSPPVSTPTTTPATSSSVLPSPVSGSTAAPTTDGATSSPDSILAGGENSSHVSGGVIAAIVIVLLLVLCAVTFFVLRWRRIRRRAARRMTWTTNLSPHANFDSSLEKGTSDAPIEVVSQSPKEGGSGHGVSPTPVRNIARKPPLPYSPVSPTVPPQSRGNSPDVRASSVRPTSVSRVSPSPTQDVPVLARMTFIPQLPDELAITPGETLYIQTEFDDGWALCANIGGKEGMVPLECLEGVGGQFAGVSQLRIMRRASSLRSASSWT